MQPQILSKDQLHELRLSQIEMWAGWTYTSVFSNILMIFDQLNFNLYTINNVIHTMISVYNLDIHANNDVVLAFGLLSKNLNIVKYLLGLGCDLKVCAEAHCHTLFKYGSHAIPDNHIEYFMELELDISWLYTISTESILHFSRRIIDHNSNFLVTVITYLASRGYYPDDKTISKVIRFDYVKIFEVFLEVMSPNMDLHWCYVTALKRHSVSILKKLSSVGIKIDIGEIDKYASKLGNREEIINLLLDSGHTLLEVLEILKYI